MKIATILGTRPQFIKAASFSKELARRKVEEIIVHTGQHYDFCMSDIFFEELEIPKPKYQIEIDGRAHGAMTGQMIEKIEKVLLKEKPNWVVVYGDTNSTIAGALAASKLGIKIAHVEAGLRSRNMAMPEEINRILTDRVSDLLFCPSQAAIDSLIKEGIDTWVNGRAVCVGDIMFDSVNLFKSRAKKPSGLNVQGSFALATVHRAENTDDQIRLMEILEALDQIGEQKSVVLPLHPRTKSKLTKIGSTFDNITFIDPVGYLEMIWLLDNCDMVLTDSGGLQKEAFYFSKPCVTLRDETEWTELIASRNNVLTGANKKKILDSYNNFDFNPDYNLALYGNGDTARLIVDAILQDKSE